MTFSSTVALLGAMIVLAAIPSPSVFAVVARSIASGFTHGFVTVIGILIGDFVFIILAIYGLSAIAQTMDSVFFLVKYLGSAYLIWLGIQLWRSKSKTVEVEGIQESSWLSNFLSGLFITLGDQKAFLFYLGFLPAFIDLKNVSIFDTSIIMAIAAISVGGVKLVYAYMADKARLLFQSSRGKKIINAIAGTVMIGTAILLLVKT